MDAATVHAPLVTYLKKFEHPFRVFILIAFAALVAQLPPGPLVAIAAAIVLLFLALRFPEPSFLVLVGLVPFLHLTIDFSQYEWSASLPLLGSLDAPAADFWAFILIIAALIRISLNWIRGTRASLAAYLPGIWWYLPFVFAGVLSLASVSPLAVGESIKYLMRPVLFSYLAYVALTSYYIRSYATFVRALKVIIVTVTAAACIGLLSLIVVPPFWGVWRRVTPFPFFGITPLGTNHNQLSEVLVTFLPIIVYAARYAGSARRKQWYMACSALVAGAAVLSFGRAAWIALAAEVGFLVWVCRPRLFGEALRRWWPGALFGMAIFVYMIIFSTSAFVQSGTTTRLDLTRIAWQLFTSSPFVGTGVGTFLTAVGETHIFVVEYGVPVEAHGLVQKLGAEMGLLGLATFSLFVGWVVHRLSRVMRHGGGERAVRDLMLALCTMVVGGITFQLFNTSYYSAKLWFPIGLALVAVEMHRGRRIEHGAPGTEHAV